MAKQQGTRSRAISEQDKQQRRQLILRSALDSFFNKGFAATRMDDVAFNAKLSKGTLYLYFASKEALFQALIEEIAVPNLEAIEQKSRAARSMDAFLSTLFDYAIHIIRDSDLPKLVKILISDARTFPAIAQDYHERVINRMFALLTHSLEQANQRGEIQINNPEATARLIVAPVVLSMIWVVIFEPGDDQPLDIRALLVEHKKMLEQGLGIEPQEVQG